MALWDWGFELENIKTPVKIFYGDADEIIDIKMPKKLHDKLPNSSIHTWPGVGHYGFVRRDCWAELLKACI
ncbi:alpha/beta fold hydrolase [Microbulbifer sp. GL-2]|uniref:alpha/beta fold hydrolase n=1 Tax=Microbulbifer sp. GL-2 TaxID=2591606 RepID=UPI0018D64224|nr:dienelactone hydrolase family protein [Microbulbifer sp. GL-2]